jgi:hypothetical protein
MKFTTEGVGNQVLCCRNFTVEGVFIPRFQCTIRCMCYRCRRRCNSSETCWVFSTLVTFVDVFQSLLYTFAFICGTYLDPVESTNKKAQTKKRKIHSVSIVLKAQHDDLGSFFSRKKHQEINLRIHRVSSYSSDGHPQAVCCVAAFKSQSMGWLGCNLSNQTNFREFLNFPEN